MIALLPTKGRGIAFMSRLILDYLWQRRQLLLFYLLCIGIFITIQLLSAQEMAYAWYAVFLVTVILLLILIVDGRAYIKRRRLLLQISERLDIIDELLPHSDGEPEATYQRFIASLCRELQLLKDNAAASRADSLHYYTVWVHQIKTPIAAMRLVLEQSNGANNDLINQELFKIERYAELALQYIKLQNIADDLVIENCDLNAIVHEAVKEYSLLFILRKLRLELEPLDKAVVSDKKWLLFIIKQLLSNALKYTKDGGIHIYMEGRRLVIADTGIGIRSEDLPRIFEKGYTGYNGRVDQRASGIGLYLTKWAADALSIDMQIESTLGQGTRVYLTFPNPDSLLFD